VTRGQDRYGRTVATVYVDGIDVNAEQVRRRMAWVYRKYARDWDLYEFEAEARTARRGVWTDPDPVPPWEWRGRARTGEPRNRRRTHRNCPLVIADQDLAPGKRSFMALFEKDRI
jgi:hypothetical protein